MRTDDRWCPNGQHWSPLTNFRELRRYNSISGVRKRARDCMECERNARIRANARAPVPKMEPMRGVDIDAIHFKLGAVKSGVRPRP